MQTQTNSPESADSMRMAYGQQVQELLSMSAAETWISDLWDIYTGYMPGRAGWRSRKWVLTPAWPTFLPHSKNWLCFLKR